MPMTLEELRIRHERAIAQAADRVTGRRRELQTEIRSRSATRERLVEDRARGAGGPAAALGAQIESLEREIRSLEAELAAITDADADFHTHARTFEGLRALRCTEAVEVEGLAGCIATLPVVEIHVDAIGRPLSATLALSRDTSVAVPVKPNRHFLSDFRPKVLNWVPTIRALPGPAPVPRPAESVLAYVDRTSDELYLTRTNLQWQVENADPFRRTDEIWLTRSVDASPVATDLSSALKKLIHGQPEGVDLLREQPGNPLYEHVRREVLERTTTEPRFRPADFRLTTEEAVRQLGPDWTALVSAPWSASITGVIARLKHEAEDGVRVRFWGEGFEGAYGFRLSTHDHDWIVGNLYVEPGRPAPAAQEAIVVEEGATFEGGRTARVGRMWIFALRTKD